ncbi:ABC transporter substrate-binding protein [Corynebacterium phocae]|uniref:ABC transporter substrate-binding protein n=1 Tax=Corynebacterium phocae TaxID=161895 RepID=A0A1L7D3F6_9CORY|nr:ABC transporter substrate-binding protein [Corynebacterium phocae]APT92613.1 ABC transporter substrate-binding protein [Corynebacterium phocae]KAA8724169.1 ABC transporter substrate-binding protein [Corynebacterium phocae]
MKKLSLIAPLLLALSLSACVTNEEPAVPEGWQEINVDTVPEIAAMVEDTDGTLTVGTSPPFAPFELKDSDGNIVGVEMDLVRALSQVMGLDFKPVEQDFSLILPSISGNQVDAGASGFTDTEERRENYDFVDILYAGIQWAQKPGDSIDPDNPCGLTIAVQRTTVSETDDVRPKAEKCLAEGKEPITVLSFDSSDNAALALLTTRADALSADSPVTAWAVNRSGGEMELTGEIFDAAPYGIAVPKDSALGPATAAALQHLIDTGVYAQILAQWGITEGLVDEAMINERPINV